MRESIHLLFSYSHVGAACLLDERLQRPKGEAHWRSFPLVCSEQGHILSPCVPRSPLNSTCTRPLLNPSAGATSSHRNGGPSAKFRRGHFSSSGGPLNGINKDEFFSP